jgi:acetyl-CoA synthetase
MLPRLALYDDIYRTFEWPKSRQFNIADVVCDRHAVATPAATALIYETEAGDVQRLSFLDLQRSANRLANTLRHYGVGRGDRVAILLGQTPETAFTHLACWKLGAISVPLFTLFRQEALSFRLNMSGARVCITDCANYATLAELRPDLPDLEHFFLRDGRGSGALSLADEMAKASDDANTPATDLDSPALLSFTSGTTGPPKGALHGHRVLMGHLPCFDLVHEFFGKEDDLAWSPADWAWVAGLMCVLLPSWYFGRPVLAHRGGGRFDAEHAYHLMAKHSVRNTLLVPTMLRLLQAAKPPEGLRLRTIHTGGEPVGADLIAWGQSTLHAPINESFGQTECNLVLANVAKFMPGVPEGSLGLPVPGHTVAILDDAGNSVPKGETGNIGVRHPDPTMMLAYWHDEEATSRKFIGDWLLTGDVGYQDDDGFFWYVGRTDDVINSSGYRIGPGEIEEVLCRHPAVNMAAVVGVPDPVRTEIIKACLVLNEGYVGTSDLEAELKEFVRAQLAEHEYPRIIEFLNSLPTTATGKVMRGALKQ